MPPPPRCGGAWLAEIRTWPCDHLPGYPGPKGAPPLGPPALAVEAPELDVEFAGGVYVLTGTPVEEETVDVLDGCVWAAAAVLACAGLRAACLTRRRFSACAPVRR